jgi:hypothetical protein
MQAISYKAHFAVKKRDMGPESPCFLNDISKKTNAWLGPTPLNLMKALEAVHRHTERAWRRWLSRRSHKGKVLLEDLRKAYPLLLPMIVHSI